MKQLVHIVRDTESLDIYLKSEEVQLATFGTSSILAQVYSMPNTTVLALDVAEIIRKIFLWRSSLAPAPLEKSLQAKPRPGLRWLF